MKKITFTVDEFLLLKKVRDASYDLYGEVEQFLEKNEYKKVLSELKVETHVFDDMIEMIKDYYKDEADPKDFSAIDALLLKLEAVEEEPETEKPEAEADDQPGVHRY